MSTAMLAKSVWHEGTLLNRFSYFDLNSCAMFLPPLIPSTHSEGVKFLEQKFFILVHKLVTLLDFNASYNQSK